MKRVLAVVSVVAAAAVFCSCAKECKCTGKHPASPNLQEVHSYGKMTSKECMDKQYRMNNDTTFITNKTWVCEN